jgi:hypothetical protein
MSDCLKIITAAELIAQAAEDDAAMLHCHACRVKLSAPVAQKAWIVFVSGRFVLECSSCEPFARYRIAVTELVREGWLEWVRHLLEKSWMTIEALQDVRELHRLALAKEAA